jgi:hypothetical protein
MTCAVVTTACVEVTITCAVVTITCVEVTTAFALVRTTCAEVTRSGQLMQRYRCFDAKVGVSRSKLDLPSAEVGRRVSEGEGWRAIAPSKFASDLY